MIVSPCSGHGAEFAPLTGSTAADLATGRAEPHPRSGWRAGMRRLPTATAFGDSPQH